MADTEAITKEQAEKAKAAPLKLAPPNVEASDAPYFVDLVRDQLFNKVSERELNDQSYRIYTTLDPDLQKAAAAAVDTGMKLVDDQVTKMRTKRIKIAKNKFETKVTPGPQAQVALVAIDPHTGRVVALVGGRNYGTSQLNHAIAKRPTVRSSNHSSTLPRSTPRSTARPACLRQLRPSPTWPLRSHTAIRFTNREITKRNTTAT